MQVGAAQSCSDARKRDCVGAHPVDHCRRGWTRWPGARQPERHDRGAVLSGLPLLYVSRGARDQGVLRPRQQDVVAAVDDFDGEQVALALARRQQLPIAERLSAHLIDQHPRHRERLAAELYVSPHNHTSRDRNVERKACCMAGRGGGQSVGFPAKNRRLQLWFVPPAVGKSQAVRVDRNFGEVALTCD
jgi:hypothetical protein